MEVLTQKYPGLMLICNGCGAVLANIQKSDIYGENFVYCPICRTQNLLNYNKNYDGIVNKGEENK